jgi:hypothetical protein
MVSSFLFHIYNTCRDAGGYILDRDVTPSLSSLHASLGLAVPRRSAVAVSSATVARREPASC